MKSMLKTVLGIIGAVGIGYTASKAPDIARGISNYFTETKAAAKPQEAGTENSKADLNYRKAIKTKSDKDGEYKLVIGGPRRLGRNKPEKYTIEFFSTTPVYTIVLDAGIEKNKGKIGSDELTIKKGFGRYVRETNKVVGDYHELEHVERGTLGRVMPLQPGAKELQEKIDDAFSKAMKTLDDAATLLRPFGIRIESDEEQTINAAKKEAQSMKIGWPFSGDYDTIGLRFSRIKQPELAIYNRILAEFPVSVVSSSALKAFVFSDRGGIAEELLIEMEEEPELTKKAEAGEIKGYNLEIKVPKKVKPGERHEIEVELGSGTRIPDAILIAGIENYLGALEKGVKTERKVRGSWIPIESVNCGDPRRYVKQSAEDERTEGSVSDPILRNRVRRELLERRLKSSGIPILGERAGIFIPALENLPLSLTGDRIGNSGIIHTDLLGWKSGEYRNDECYGMRWKIPMQIVEKAPGDGKVPATGKVLAYVNMPSRGSLVAEEEVEIKEPSHRRILSIAYCRGNGIIRSMGTVVGWRAENAKDGFFEAHVTDVEVPSRLIKNQPAECRIGFVSSEDLSRVTFIGGVEDEAANIDVGEIKIYKMAPASGREWMRYIIDAKTGKIDDKKTKEYRMMLEDGSWIPIKSQIQGRKGRHPIFSMFKREGEIYNLDAHFSTPWLYSEGVELTGAINTNLSREESVKGVLWTIPLTMMGAGRFYYHLIAVNREGKDARFSEIFNMGDVEGGKDVSSVSPQFYNGVVSYELSDFNSGKVLKRVHDDAVLEIYRDRRSIKRMVEDRFLIVGEYRDPDGNFEKIFTIEKNGDSRKANTSENIELLKEARKAVTEEISGGWGR